MTPHPIEVVAADGCALRGLFWSGGPDWTVLLHDVGPDEDLDRWRPLIPALLAADVAILAVDLRGHGASDGEWHSKEAIDDVITTIEFARARGAEFVAVIAAGASAADVLLAADKGAPDAAVLLSAQAPTKASSLTRSGGIHSGPWPETRVSLPRGSGIPRLFLVGAHDLASRHATDDLRRASIGWAAAVTFPTHEHGTELLHGEWLGHVSEQILGFVREQHYLASSRTRGA
jgi:pimeloyl-ACP methyl ester carboxylesterase